MQSVRSSSRRRRGGALVLFTLMLPFVILPMVGLAIDGAMLFNVKAKLVSAVDGGAIAAARSLNVGMNFDDQKASATKTAEQFVHANFPAGYWGSRNVTFDPPVDVREDTTATIRRRTVAITASVEVPLLFMRIIGQRSATVRAWGTAARRDVRMVLVLDKSHSMVGPDSDGAPMNALKAAAADFVGKFSEGRDQLGLVVFGGSALVAFPPFDPDTGTGPTSTFKSASPSIETLIGSMKAGYTNTGMAEALSLAYDELLKHPLTGAFNVIVLFTDGMPNGITAKFNETGSSVIKSGHCAYAQTTEASKVMIGTLAQQNSWSTAHRSNANYGILQRMNAPTTGHPTVTSWLAEDKNQEGTIPAPPSQGCSYTGGHPSAVAQDLNAIPSLDLFGNPTDGGGYIYSKLYHDHGGVGLNLSNVDVAYQVGLASWNAVDGAARRIRNDTHGITPVIYTIGLEGSDGADAALMKRISNVNDSSNYAYDSSKPAGKYFPAPDTGYLQQAFSQVASEILRLIN